MNDIQKAIQDARAERLNHMYKTFSNLSEVKEDDEALKKAKDAEEEVEDEEEDNGMGEEVRDEEKEEKTEKSDIMGAISGYGDSKIKVSKTGKEIKEQVDSVIMPELTANLAAKEIEANNKLKDCGAAPTHCPDPWWTDDVRMDCGYKIYDWREREWCSNENRMYPSLSAEDSAEKKGNCPTSEAEAKARCEYNDIVRCICNIKVDIKACEILKTLKDTSTYELTPRQVLTLRF